MEFPRSFIISLRRFKDGSKSANYDSFAIGLDSDKPSFALFCKTDPLETARISAMLSAILLILSMGANSEICFAIVESVPIPMVNLFGAFAVQNHSVHSSTFRLGIEDISVPLGPPIILAKMQEIFRVNYGNLILRKWNKAVRFTKRLSYSAPKNAGLWHIPTSIGMRHSAAILA